MSNKEIHRYKLDNTNDLGPTSFCRVDLPKGAKVINVTYLYGDIYLHAIVNPKHEKKARWFAVYTEGYPMEDYEKKTCEYIGMTITNPTHHVFEVHD
jgi:hypothetical protein